MDDQTVRDQLEITNLLTRYARAVDTKDWELYRSVFTEDATIDYSSAGAIVGIRDQVVDWFSQAFGVIPWTMHYITNVDISGIEAHPDGDTATVTAMFYNPMQLPGMAEPSYCGGYYHHQLIRTTDGWRSRNLREENLWFRNQPSGAHQM
jgi:ketosteroid isomerase-like protein